MNRTYKVIWNTALGTWIAVSELVKGRGKTKSRKIGLAIAISTTIGFSSDLLAGYEIGGGSTFTNCDANTVGSGTESTGIAIGNEVQVVPNSNAQTCAPTNNSIAIGAGATTKASATPTVPYNQSIAIGNFARAQGDQAVALGGNVIASGNSSIAIGGDDIDRIANDTAVNNEYQRLTGVRLVAGNAPGGSYRSTTSSGAGASAMGTQAMASGNFSSAIGMTSSASGTASVALGVFSNASAGAALAIGSISKAQAEQSIAIGTNAQVQAQATNSIAIGNGAVATNANSIALGANSRANSTTLSNQAYLVNGSATSEVNIGNRRITGVSAGSSDTDAVNVSQLRKAAQISKTEVVEGKNINVSSITGTDGQTVYTVATDDNINVESLSAGDPDSGNFSELTSAGLNVSNDAGNTTTVGAEQITVGGTNSIAINGTTGNISGLTNTTVGNADFATAGRAATEEQLNQSTTNAATIIGGGVANTNGTLSGPFTVNGTGYNNIAEAIGDVANQTNKGWNLSTDTGVTSNVKPGDIVNFNNTDSNINISNQNNNVTVNLNSDLKIDSVTAGNNTLDATGIKFGTSVAINDTGLIIANGPSVTSNGINASNKVISNLADGKLSSDAVNKGQLDTAISNINSNVAALSDSAVQYDKNVDGSVNKGSISLAGGIDGTKITNVANGKIEFGSKDAINGGQLATVKDDLQGQITANTADINNIKNDLNAGTVGLVKQANSNADITVAKDTGGSKVNVSGTAGDRVITGVSKGNINSTSSDAINGSQLNVSNQYIASSLGGGAAYDNITQSFNSPNYKVGEGSYKNVGDAVEALNNADIVLGNKINNLGDQLQQAFYTTNERIDSIEKRANAGIAAAMALESAPYIPGKYTYAAGASYHGGENAVGITLRKTADNGRWSLTGGVASASQGDPSVRIGISGVID